MTDRVRATDVARLVRLPLVLSVLGDPIVGWVLAGGGLDPWPLAGLALASACLYTGGMALNDWCDLDVDRAKHPDRVLPSGRVPAGLAFRIAAGLLVGGVVIASLVAPMAGVCAAATVAAIVAYDAWLKRFAVLGCVAMGLCRGLDVAIGAVAVGAWPPPGLALAAVAAHVVYTAAVTAVSLLEERSSVPRGAVAVRFALGVVPLVALLWTPRPAVALAIAGFAVAHLAAALGTERRLGRPRVMRTVGAGVRGILLVDTAWLWGAGAWLLGGLTLGLFAIAEVRARR